MTNGKTSSGMRNPSLSAGDGAHALFARRAQHTSLVVAATLAQLYAAIARSGRGQRAVVRAIQLDVALVEVSAFGAERTRLPLDLAQALAEAVEFARIPAKGPARPTCQSAAKPGTGTDGKP